MRHKKAHCNKTTKKNKKNVSIRPTTAITEHCITMKFQNV